MSFRYIEGIADKTDGSNQRLYKHREQGGEMSDQAEEKQLTLDGKRLGMHELNMGVDAGPGKLKRIFRNLSAFLAGMYSGESCAGTPHSEHRSQPPSSATRKPDS